MADGQGPNCCCFNPIYTPKLPFNKDIFPYQVTEDVGIAIAQYIPLIPSLVFYTYKYMIRQGRQ
ncbi:hypothetical protein GYH30_005767 [Glycine max]|uniref:Uncharacterized protein n=1 Tax=Glycine max TaxID=3847 RepID=A0A0R0L474_SOYBN|nr:hypothetical protein GYH30_005767 [Glycine max]